ncbi:MAG: aminotransferase class III-fold pyridoxal phosphate-dependent enzyme [Gammaproteobacteria bacterium]|nr:aminotransferase class III-fold pyridoxal phosphate-dependent enzyme [Gammaproteobacteria bacterium]
MKERESLLERRARLIGERAPLFYDEPVHIVRGEGVWLFDADGKRYLDCYNNVAHVGHCHPQVVDAIARQSATLNTHTRYLHEGILDYAERLTATFDKSLSSLTLTCTGSEANDIALRMARLCTGGMGIICTDNTYHGNTATVDELSTLFNEGKPRSPHVRAIPFPETYRPLRDLEGEALADVYADEVRKAIDSFRQAGIRLAGMLFCPIFANEGLPTVPPGFLKKAVNLVHEAGGLFIADEVQAGFGRTGTMWGHQISGIVPDIVTLGKPMGNGYPVAGLVTRVDLLARFRQEIEYFNTFGGNPVACAAASAVLDVMEKEQLMDNARTVGDYIRVGLGKLARRHARIGDIRGQGLWVGVELVRDRQSREPAPEETKQIMNRMKDRGVIMGRIGRYDNVLKMRPPMPFSRDNADLLLGTLDEVFGSP